MLVRAVAGSSVVQVAGMLFTFAVGVLLARGLGVEGYGQYGIAMAVIALGSIPGEFGIPKLVLRETAAAAGRGNWPAFFGVLRWADATNWKFSVGIALIIIAGVFLFLDDPTTGIGAAIVVGAPIIPLFTFAKIRSAALQGLNYVALGQIPSVLLRPLLLSLLLLAILMLGGDLTAPNAMAVNCLTAAAAWLVAYLWLRRRLTVERPAQVTEAGRQWFSSAIALGLGGGVRTLQAQLLIILLGLLASSAEVGLFRIAASTTVMLMAPMTVVQLVTSPQFARLHAQGDRLRLQKLAKRAAQAQFAGVLALSLPLFVAAEPIVAFVFGDEFEASAGPLRLLLIGQIVNSAFGPNVPLLNMTHHERRVVRAMLIALFLGVATIAALAPIWGMFGAAAAFLVSMSTWNLLTWLDARQLLGIDTSLLPTAAVRRRS